MATGWDQIVTPKETRQEMYIRLTYLKRRKDMQAFARSLSPLEAEIILTVLRRHDSRYPGDLQPYQEIEL